MSECECRAVDPTQEDSRKTIKIALALNAAMFVVGMAAGVAGQSVALIADALDMLADASAFAIALLAFERAPRFKALAARSSGLVLLLLGIGVLLDALRRGIYGSSPHGQIMMAVAAVSLVVNSTVLYLLEKQSNTHEVHVRAAYIFTRADVVANLGVIGSGLILFFTRFRYIDLIAGCAIGIYVIREAAEILQAARKAL